MVALKARKLDLQQALRLLNFELQFDGEFEPYLSLGTIGAPKQQELEKLVDEFRRYYRAGKISEGQIRAVSVLPMLRLAGYHEHGIELKIEEDIARIHIVDEDTYITGRFDIVAVHRDRLTKTDTPLWILVIESKNNEASDSAGIAQMLAYAHSSLDKQDSVWGLVTNGDIYQFFHLQKGNPSICEYMPMLMLRERRGSQQILQVLTAIRES